MFAWCAALRAQQHDIDGLQVREEAKVGEGGFSTIWRVRLMADRGPADETLPAVMALKKTICQDEERLDFAINEVDILKRVAQVPGACRKLPGLAVCQGSGAGREFIVQYFSHKASFVDGKLSVSSSERLEGCQLPARKSPAAEMGGLAQRRSMPVLS
ncbi:unnamed protein product [Effrenium voratum]|uniref:Protein kinase domain-containing protein n=1 Tax=Effrenium voratum TaxID=2562239 RepID=A0AA36NDM1_9DINO|nr:unnamed protein product [Effrenium voratum]CAJ1448539.1 unnamed protein product [Effrenium voratum]